LVAEKQIETFPSLIDMKACLKSQVSLLVLVAAIGAIVAGECEGQTFKTLHTFTPFGSGGEIPSFTQSGSTLVSAPNPLATNSDGAFPIGLVLSGQTLYGAASGGGSGGSGTLFSLRIDGSGLTILHDFTTCSTNPFSEPVLDIYTNAEGASPDSLILSDGTLFGAAMYGGISGGGTVYKMNTDSAGFTVVHDTSNGGGFYPYNLTLAGNTLFGANRGIFNLFKVHKDGTSFANLDPFGADGYGSLLVSPDGLLYGTAYGSWKYGGLLFVGNVTNDSPVFHDLFHFDISLFPSAGLTLSSNILYWGVSGVSGVFAIRTDGSGFTVLTNSEGASPNSLLISGSTLYGTAPYGGRWGQGTVFAFNTDGTRFVTLHTFTGDSDGAYPQGGLVLSGDTLYGTTAYGGSAGNGTIFSITLPPPLTIIASGPNVVLSWPTNFTGYTMQSATNVGSLAVWATNLPSPVVVNGQYTLTNSISGTRQFFRLIQ
jgi:uncharacterized repeat protein (TIGR03803 family)